MTRPQEWLLAIRDRPDRPDGVQRDVLTMLTLRLDWTGSGRGFASVPDLMADTGVSRSTVERALGWARGEGGDRDRRFFLVQTKRGHRQGDGSRKSSEWLLRLPGDPPYVPPPGKAGGSLRVTGDPPSIPSTPRPSSVADVDQSATGSRAALEDLIEIVHNELARKDPPVYLDHEWAAKTVGQIPGHIRPARRAAYLRAMIRNEPDPRTRFGPHPYPDRYVAPPPLPPWRPP